MRWCSTACSVLLLCVVDSAFGAFVPEGARPVVSAEDVRKCIDTLRTATASLTDKAAELQNSKRVLLREAVDSAMSAYATATPFVPDGNGSGKGGDSSRTGVPKRTASKEATAESKSVAQGRKAESRLKIETLEKRVATMKGTGTAGTKDGGEKLTAKSEPALLGEVAQEADPGDRTQGHLAEIASLKALVPSLKALLPSLEALMPSLKGVGRPPSAAPKRPDCEPEENIRWTVYDEKDPKAFETNGLGNTCRNDGKAPGFALGLHPGEDIWHGCGLMGGKKQNVAARQAIFNSNPMCKTWARAYVLF